MAYLDLVFKTFLKMAEVTNMMAKPFEKLVIFLSIVGHFGYGSPLALPGPALTPSASPRPGLNCATVDNALFESNFQEQN